jgi:hypothetical protein
VILSKILMRVISPFRPTILLKENTVSVLSTGSRSISMTLHSGSPGVFLLSPLRVEMRPCEIATTLKIFEKPQKVSFRG